MWTYFSIRLGKYRHQESEIERSFSRPPKQFWFNDPRLGCQRVTRPNPTGTAKHKDCLMFYDDYNGPSLTVMWTSRWRNTKVQWDFVNHHYKNSIIFISVDLNEGNEEVLNVEKVGGLTEKGEGLGV